ncbi:MAG: UDP-2,3-diacylglucosamine diphosphatase [Bacteroidota bacterium]|nr:UDP-2,3-diacylglucosamine diphosphatase [Bacteroidota bacterium]
MISENKKIYFASDFHLGNSSVKENLKREKKIVSWLNEIKKDAKSIYLIGDIFDFWFEYKQVVPKGFVRLLGSLAELSDRGIKIHFVVGNHDLWMKDYFSEQIDATIHYNNLILEESDKKIFIGHGDGLGDGDYLYKLLKKVFTSKICQWLFQRLHPDFSVSLAKYWSEKNASRKKNPEFKSEQEELLVGYCKKQQQKERVDYYIFGHRHLPLKIPIDQDSYYINTGDWINHFSYAVFDGKKLNLEKF